VAAEINRFLPDSLATGATGAVAKRG